MSIHLNAIKAIVFFSIFAIPYAYAQTNLNTENKPISTKSPPTNQPLVIIDATKLINNTKTITPRDTANNIQNTNPPPNNNVRIGSNGQYIDNSKTEQINSKGLICTSESGKKTCN
jgi:hypothetical protein